MTSSNVSVKTSTNSMCMEEWIHGNSNLFENETIIIPSIEHCHSTTKNVCLCIPTMSLYFTREYIQCMMGFIGRIFRIDFMEIKNLQTLMIDEKYRKVFIHFDMVFDNPESIHLFDYIRGYGCMDMAVSYAMQTETWRIYITVQPPVKNTEWNVHQLSHSYHMLNKRFVELEIIVNEQKIIIERQQHTLNALILYNNLII
jgi:hypothetical protein